MAYYKKKATFHTLENAAEPLLLFLRQNCEMLKPDGSQPINGIREAFYANRQDLYKVSNQYKAAWNAMRLGSFIETAPLSDDYNELLVYVLEEKSSFLPTATKTHIRLPKLSHLITLTPEDFFRIFYIIASSHSVAVGTTFAIYDEEAVTPSISPFFITNNKTWRPNPEFADQKWTNKDDIEFIASLVPNERNQFYAMQYLTVRQNPDLLYFPIDSAVGLELEWEQIDDNYCVPETRNNF